MKDNLTLDLRVEWSKPVKDIPYFGGKHPYNQVRLAVLYAF